MRIDEQLEDWDVRKDLGRESQRQRCFPIVALVFVERE